MATFVIRNGVSVNKATGEPMLSEEKRNAPLQTPKVFGDYPAYRSPITGEWIEGRRARQYDMQKHNCVDGNDQPLLNDGKLKNERFAKKHKLTHRLE